MTSWPLGRRAWPPTPRGRDAYVYFNNDPEGHAIADARRLMAMLGPLAARPAEAATAPEG